MISSLSLNQLLALYSWFPLAALLMFLLLIARFYEKFSGQRMYFKAFFIPLVLFGLAIVRYASIDGIAGDRIGDTAMVTGGITLVMLCLVVYWRMLRKQGLPKSELLADVRGDLRGETRSGELQKKSE